MRSLENIPNGFAALLLTLLMHRVIFLVIEPIDRYSKAAFQSLKSYLLMKQLLEHGENSLKNNHLKALSADPDTRLPSQ